MACLSAAIFSGCWWGGADGVPFYYSKKDKQQQLADLEHYGPFAFQRIETIKKMGEYAAKSPQLEKEKVAAKLASNIQTEQDPLVRMVIIRELGRIPTEISSSVLTAGIKDPDPEVRMEVCTAWGKRVHQSLAKGGGIPPGPTEDSAVRVLAGALASDTNFDVRMFAARALGEVPRDPRAIAALGIALKGSTDPAMTYNVVTSLKSVSGKDFGSDVKQWQQFADSFIPQAIVPPTGLGQQAPSAIASRPSRTN
ncbi:MAG TPA: HEAT repeat domain-containing protein [Pirellulales bacterium]|nr:HEAT repeat domain-containing protein [Pirellulales bacterium]